MGTSHVSDCSTVVTKTHLCRCGCGSPLAPFVDTASRATRYLPGHFDRTILQNFDFDPETGCWIWRGKPTREGHGQICRNRRTVTAHVFFYEALVHELEPGVTLHHTCPNRLCVNPDHQAEMTHEAHRHLHALRKWQLQKANPSLRLIGNISLTTVCAWCKRTITEGPEPVSHGICPECAATIELRGVPGTSPHPTSAGELLLSVPPSTGVPALTGAPAPSGARE